MKVYFVAIFEKFGIILFIPVTSKLKKNSVLVSSCFFPCALHVFVALTVFFSCVCLSAFVRADIVDRIRDDNDGRDRRYGSPAWRGRYRFTIGHILNIIVRLFLHSSLFASSRILVCRPWHNLSPLHPLDVPPSDPLLDYKLERRFVGNSRGPSEENQKGSFLCVVSFLSFFHLVELCLSLSRDCKFIAISYQP